MDRQAFVDKAVRYIRRNGSSMTLDGSCMYRGPGRKKCALGVHIDPKKSDAAALLIRNEQSPEFLLEKSEQQHLIDALRESGIPTTKRDERFIMAFQQAHDVAAGQARLGPAPEYKRIPFTKGFEVHLAEFCKKFRLKVPA